MTLHDTDYQDLETACFHTFEDKSVLIQSLTHSSFVSMPRPNRPKNANKTLSNERLEFLGDRILGFIIADKLYQLFPQETEGQLARRYAILVSKEILQTVAQAIQLERYIILSPSEESNRTNTNIVADCCESLIAALYYDGGIKTAQKFIFFYWNKALHSKNIPPLDPKNALQEWAQNHSLPLPTYTLIKKEGPDHTPTFTIAASIKGYPSQSASSYSKKDAIKKSAEKLFLHLESKKKMSTNLPQTNEQNRFGFVAIIGETNVGKSTFLNTITGNKISIVTHKIQTTRTRITGLCIHKKTQIAFIDTPGIFEPKRRLDRAMIATAWSSSKDADITIIMIDSQKGITQHTQKIIHHFQKLPPNFPLILVLNKIDLIKREKLLPLTQQMESTGLFTAIFMLSALKKDGLEKLLSFIASSLPKSQWHFPEDQISDMPLRFLTEEITREQIYLHLHQELPYTMMVDTETWEQRNGDIKIEQIIRVEKANHKASIIGKNGKKIKTISITARKEMEAVLQCKVHLFLYVKIQEKWSKTPFYYNQWGLDFNV